MMFLPENQEYKFEQLWRVGRKNQAAFKFMVMKLVKT